MPLPDAATLLTYMQADAQGRGYANMHAGTGPFTGSPNAHSEMRNALNAPRAGNGIPAAYNATAGQILGTVDPTEALALSTQQLQLWGWVLTAAAGEGGVNLWDPQIQSILQDVWGPGTATRAALIALRSGVDGEVSDAQAEWGGDVVIPLSLVREAGALWS